MGGTTTMQREVGVASGGAELAGILTLPVPVVGLVLFAHGSGSSRLSHRNHDVARVLVERGWGRSCSICSPLRRSGSIGSIVPCASTSRCWGGV